MAAILLTAGCAAQADLNYRKPTQPSLTNSRTVNAGFEETWDRLVRNLSSEFFVINNIEKASRIINVSFQTDAPERYVDCGVTHRTYTSPTGKKAVYTYGTAGDSVFMYATTNRSEEHTSELQSLMRISYAVFCLKKKK